MFLAILLASFLHLTRIKPDLIFHKSLILKKITLNTLESEMRILKGFFFKTTLKTLSQDSSSYQNLPD